jgi:hypothetical protein
VSHFAEVLTLKRDWGGGDRINRMRPRFEGKRHLVNPIHPVKTVPFYLMEFSLPPCVRGDNLLLSTFFTPHTPAIP